MRGRWECGRSPLARHRAVGRVGYRDRYPHDEKWLSIIRWRQWIGARTNRRRPGNGTANELGYSGPSQELMTIVYTVPTIYEKT